MMNIINTLLHSPKSAQITIQQVSNGWMVTVPDQGSTAALNEILSKVQRSMNDDENDLSSILNKDEEEDTEGLKLSKNNSVFIFTNFLQVLAFLSENVKD